MNSFVVLIIFFELINLSFTFVPVWDLEKSSVNLGNEGSIPLYSKTSEYPKIQLSKEFSINNGEFYEQNYIRIDDSQEFNNKVEWEDIESTYHLEENGNMKYYICPKGKFFISRYDGSSYYPIKPNSFDNDNKGINNEDNWELICYHISEKNIMFQGFLNQEKIEHFYGHANFPNEHQDLKNVNLQMSFYDFLWSYQSGNSEYRMLSLVLRENKIYLKTGYFTYQENEVKYNGGNEKELCEKRDFSSAYFDYKTSKFYWVSASSTNDFSSGYSTTSVDAYTNVNDFSSFTKNDTSPLQFLNNVIINKLNMIRNTKYAYYEVTSKEDDSKHYGIIDIEKNQVIFNTNEALIEFKPISSTSMLAVTQDSAYQVCFMKEGNECKTECPNGNTMIIDALNGNSCGTSNTCEGGIIFKPDDICIPSCNTSIYIENEGQCGLCKTFFPGQKEFKIFNETDCYKEQPNSTYFISEEFKILGRCYIENCLYCSNKDSCKTCNEGYLVDNGKCVEKSEEKQCYETCKVCDVMGDKSNQKCTECKEENDLLQEGNCVENCYEGYYQEEKNCKKCNDNCKSCSICQ